MLAVIRHGQSLANAEVYKTSPHNLTDDNNVLTVAGVQGALDAGAHFKSIDYNPDLIVTSGLARAKQTGLIIASVLRTGVPFVHDKTFEEIRWYDSEGVYRAYTADEYYNHIDNPPHASAESQRDVFMRVIPAFKDLARDSLNKKYILVCHYFVVRAIQSFLESGGPGKMSEFDPKNTDPIIFGDDVLSVRI